MKEIGTQYTNFLYDTPLLATKLHIPTTSVETLVRTRLIDQLNQCTQCRLTLLSAPAGFGKSTLLQHWAQQVPERPAWISLDMADNDLIRFWRYVISAIDSIRPGFGEKVADVVKLIHPSDYVLALTMLLNELQQMENPLKLVLDDFHAITDERLLASFAYFLEHVPEQTHLILASRTELPLPTAKLHSRQQMNRLDIEEFRFTPQEGDEFYRTCMSLDLPEEETGKWVQRTEGWITAMKLAALSMRSTDHPSILLRNYTGASSMLEQYLMEEVFVKQSETVRRFLLDCSVLKRMNASLCQSVTGHDCGQEMLELLEREQLFVIPLGDRRDWYRFHHLFAEFLYRRLERTNPSRIPVLQEAAGQWCEREGLREEALDYYLTCREYDRAVGLLKEMTAKMTRVNELWLGAQFARIPESLLLAHPILYFSYALLLLLGNDDCLRGERMLQFAEQAYEEKISEWTAEARDEFWACYFFVKAMKELVTRGDQQKVIEYMMRSKQHKPGSVGLILPRPNRVGLPSILKVHAQNENEDHGKEVLISVLSELSDLLERADLAAPTIACLAECYYEFNELEEAEKVARKAIRLMDLYGPSGTSDALLPARLVLSRIQRIRGSLDAAKETMRETRRDIVELGMADSLIYCDAELALIALENGDTAPSDAWVRLYRLEECDGFTVRQLFEYVYWAKLMMKRGDDRQAWLLTDRLLAVAEQGDRYYLQVEIGLMQVLLLHRSGRTDEALLRLLPILLVTEPRGLKRVYLDAHEPMAELVALLLQSRYRPKEGKAPSLGYLRSLLSAFGRKETAGNASADLELILTKKELEIYGLLVRRLTNREIAEKLGIGYGTVRVHLNHIYSKLYVNDRSEAILKGEQIGL
ncbi:LuxR C-terminal-related transcriptional regulator [Paenibacillus sp. SC116]|uniref:LuxR C-terminal-related transcriptional regulator n=1 Tax=Paenibacillus sp. SC116 TaxID=2968986 RepID=UPI00215A7399|nr:LuxR C-terminal-related transcriptional regulator [Paenibacillus sp. SC116]MCR8842605.1 LuxR C-terminal-related transcriptional regulator [Paenibacillus sp. SC116]